jgi:uncharacterized membrane protein
MLQIFKRNFLAGLAVTLPVAGALWIFISIATWVDDIFPDAWRPKVFHHPLPGLGLVVATIVILGVGSLARNFLGQQLISWGDKVVEHIPVFGKTYGLLKQIVQAVFGKQRDAFRRAVLVRYPHSHAWSVGFVTHVDPEVEYKINKKIVAVYVPTTPNPTSGYYIFVPEEETIPLDMHVDQALKLVVTMGIAKTESGLINLAEVSNKAKG